MEFAPSLDVIINETLPALQKVSELCGDCGQYCMVNTKSIIEPVSNCHKVAKI